MVMLTDEEMAARVARKRELILQKEGASKDYQEVAKDSQAAIESSIRSDINPEAGQNLRSRSLADNARASLAKQDELKSRSKKQKRDDLCEMLGRGC